MKSKDTARITKGIIFAGCSFTWGQGLYYYSNLSTLREPLPDHYDEKLLTPSHKRYMESVRYPRLVANHFKTFEHVHPNNGGSNQGAVHWWKNCLTNRDPGAWYGGHNIPPIEYEEVSHLVFQLTQWQRDNFFMEVNGEKHEIPFHMARGDDRFKEMFLTWVDQKGLTVDQWIDQYIRDGLDNVKSLLAQCEEHGIKTMLFSWPDDYPALINEDPWLKERFLTFDYKGVNYDSIQNLMSPGAMHSKGYNPELTVKWDEEQFEVTPKDHHPSVTCHQVMAENIIKRIEKLA
jgi:hypothetical protein